MKLSDFSLTDAAASREELYAIQAVFNRTRTEYPRDSTVSGVFAQRAAQSPDAPAVLDGEHRYSYQELDRYANCIARFLLERGLQPETLVGLILSQPFHLAAAMLGVLRSGGAYLPLDPSMPPAHPVHAGRQPRAVPDRREALYPPAQPAALGLPGAAHPSLYR